MEGEGIAPSVRQARVEDVEAVADLWCELQALQGALDARLQVLPAARERYAEYLSKMLATEHAAAFVAEAPGRAVGYLYGEVHQRPTLALPDCGYIADLYVRPDDRLRGAGRALFEAMRVWYNARGISVIEVQVVRANTASQAFWRKMGFSDFLRTLRSP